MPEVRGGVETRSDLSWVEDLDVVERGVEGSCLIADIVCQSANSELLAVTSLFDSSDCPFLISNEDRHTDREVLDAISHRWRRGVVRGGSHVLNRSKGANGENGYYWVEERLPATNSNTS